MKLALESDNLRVETANFAAKKAAWRVKGKLSCRHGVLFSRAPAGGCKFMCSSTVPTDWEHAKLMPSISTELRTIVAVPFALATYVRLGLLQARLRQLDP
jgi:hypothetical protein